MCPLIGCRVLFLSGLAEDFCLAWAMYKGHLFSLFIAQAGGRNRGEVPAPEVAADQHYTIPAQDGIQCSWAGVGGNSAEIAAGGLC